MPPFWHPGGLGAWTSTTNYSLDIEDQYRAISCSYFYCAGGCIFAGSPAPVNGATSAAYFAQLSPASQGGGVGAWTSTTNYPVNIQDQSYVIPSTGIGGWLVIERSAP